MSAAMSQMSYQGTFVYVQGDTVETMRITHVAGKEGVRERLVSVSGAPREILRDSAGVRWVLAEDRAVLTDPAFRRSFFPELPPGADKVADSSYRLELGGKARIAGHVGQNVRILPLDQYRYGYSLWLEERSGLLLKWKLVDSQANTLAKLMFTDLSLGSEVDARELESSSQLKQFRNLTSSLPSTPASSGTPPHWLPRRLPPGFRLTSHRFAKGNPAEVYEHMVYSDGLAAVSVYVESVTPEGGPEGGVTRLGTTHTYSRLDEDMLITVVGDVPAVTVKFIAEAVGPVARD
jgi:sigma-E factor negative regulatory protein RseB